VRAAIEEFAARGYHHTSVEDIVRSARTSRTAFYAFFDNREDAMYGALQASLHALLAAVRKGMADANTNSSLIEVGVTAYVEFLVSDPAAARILLPWLDRLEAVVLGGDREAVRATLAERADLEPIDQLAQARFLAVPDPRLRVLQELPYELYAAEVTSTAR